MPDNVKTILKRAYLEDKPYNDIALHLEREMRLNGLGAPDETTLVPLTTVDAVVTDDKKEQQQRRYCSTVANMATTKHSVADIERSDTTPTQKRTIRILIKMNRQSPNAIRVERCTKPKTVGTELIRQMTPGNENENSPSQRTRSANTVHPSKKLKSPRLRFGEEVDARAYTIEDPPNRYEDFFIECNEEPTQDWQRRWNVGMILRHNARHPEDPTPQLQWITEWADSYATLKRPLPESKTERIYIYDMYYRENPWDEPTIYVTNKLSFRIQDPNPQAQPTETINLPSPPSPIPKKTTPSPTVPVTITSTPINAENIICIEDKTIWAQQEREQRGKTDSPASPPKTAPTTLMTDEEITECPSTLPEDLDVIKEFIQHDKEDDYNPLMSAIALKKNDCFFYQLNSTL